MKTIITFGDFGNAKAFPVRSASVTRVATYTNGPISAFRITYRAPHQRKDRKITVRSFAIADGAFEYHSTNFTSFSHDELNKLKEGKSLLTDAVNGKVLLDNLFGMSEQVSQLEKAKANPKSLFNLINNAL